MKVSCVCVALGLSERVCRVSVVCVCGWGGFEELKSLSIPISLPLANIFVFGDQISATSAPALVLPCGTVKGVPVGVQLVVPLYHVCLARSLHVMLSIIRSQ